MVKLSELVAFDEEAVESTILGARVFIDRNVVNDSDESVYIVMTNGSWLKVTAVGQAYCSASLAFEEIQVENDTGEDI